MKTYIYFNDKETHFFKAENKETAYNKVVNTFDLSYNTHYFEVLDKDDRTFTIKADIGVLRLRNHYPVNWVGNGVINFKLSM